MTASTTCSCVVAFTYGERKPQLQIIEVVTRMAMTMKSRAKGAEAKLSLTDHLKRLITRHIRPCAQEIDPDEWRTERLFQQVSWRVGGLGG